MKRVSSPAWWPEAAMISSVRSETAEIKVARTGALNNVRVDLMSKKNKLCRIEESYTCERVFSYELERNSGLLEQRTMPSARRNPLWARQ